MIAPVTESKQSVSKWFRDLRNDYTLGRFDRLRRDRRILRTGVDHDFLQREETIYLAAIETARDMENNDPIVGMGMRKLVANVLMTGLGGEPNTGMPELDRELDQEWSEYSSDPTRIDFYGDQDLNAMERTVLRRFLFDGDIWPAWTNRGSIQLLEAHRVRSPRASSLPLPNGNRIVNGVELTPDHAKVALWVAPVNTNPHKSTSTLTVERVVIHDAIGVPAICQVFDPHRVASTRGASVMNPAGDLAEKHEDLFFAKLVQSQAVSCFGFIRENPYGEIRPQTGATAGHLARDREDAITRYGEVIEDLQPGSQLVAMEGEKFTPWTAQVPNPEFFEHSYATLQLIAVNLDLPLVALLLDARQTNFSGFRGALDQARLRFRQIQQIVSKFRRFAYVRWMLDKMMANPNLVQLALERSLDLFGFRVTPPVWPYLQPNVDVIADVNRLRNGMISPRRLHQERGQNVREIQAETVEDNLRAIELAQEAALMLNLQYPDNPVHWREILQLPLPEGMMVSLSNDGEDNSPAPTSESIAT